MTRRRTTARPRRNPTTGGSAGGSRFEEDEPLGVDTTTLAVVAGLGVVVYLATRNTKPALHLAPISVGGGGSGTGTAPSLPYNPNQFAPTSTAACQGTSRVVNLAMDVNFYLNAADTTNTGGVIPAGTTITLVNQPPSGPPQPISSRPDPMPMPGAGNTPTRQYGMTAVDYLSSETFPGRNPGDVTGGFVWLPDYAVPFC